MPLRKKSPTTPKVGVVLLLQVPRTNDKKELAAEQLFASLHGLLTSPKLGMFKPTARERISLEIAVRKKRIAFYVWVPEELKDFVEEQIYAQYPTVQISLVSDYAIEEDQQYQTHLLAELKLTGHEALPLKTFQSFEVDPLAAITAALAKFEDGEEAWLQHVIRPAQDNWHRKSESYIAGMRSSGGGGNFLQTVSALWAPPEASSQTQTKLTEYEQARVSGAEMKSQKLAYETAIRIVYRGNLPVAQAKLRMQAIIASYKQFNTTYLNGFAQRRLTDNPAALDIYRNRTLTKGFMCNIEEIATLYHLPHTNVETPFILWASSNTAEPPANLPIMTGVAQPEISPIAVTNFRGHNTGFGLPRVDRGRHMYIIGQTGVGKSGMLELMTISDIYSPFGFAVIDPHGDYALNILKRIPDERVQDVVYFNPADTDFPIAFNPMEVTDPKLKTHTASELIGVLKRMFESWGPRLEYILRYSLLALLDYPDATMLDITRILTDKKFRTEVLTYVEDPVVKNFWLVEFASWNDKFAAEAVAPVLNKVGAFTANPIVRNIIGQPKSSFNIRQIMDERKILVVNLSRGLIGEDNAALLGALLVTKIQLGAMSRADIPQAERSPFYLYVDEFQNFATESFATILSEARKYGLNLTVANQYIAQMSQEVKDAVFGNVGSVIAFRMGADDARVMQRYFEPKFLEYDLVHMHNRHFVISMTIEGEKIQAFSATSMDLPDYIHDYTSEIVERSRERYAFKREDIESFVRSRYITPEQAFRQMNERPRPNREGRPVVPSQPKPQAVIPSQPAVVPKDVSRPEVPAVVTNAKPQHPSSTQQDSAASQPTRLPGSFSEDGAPKRKRKRTRRKKSSDNNPESNLPTSENTQSRSRQERQPNDIKVQSPHPATSLRNSSEDETLVRLR